MRCENCGGVVNGDNTCVSCGLINGRVLVLPNPRFNPDEENNGGQHLSYPRKNLGSDLELTSNNFHKFSRLRRLNNRARREKWLVRPLVNIAKLCDWLGLPHSVRDGASYLYRKFQKFERPSDYRVYACAVVFITCRRRGIPRTEAEVLKFASQLEQSTGRTVGRPTTKGYFRKAVRRVLDELEIELPPAKPEQYLPRLAYRLGLGPEELAEAYRLLGEMDTRNRHPTIVASAVLWRASKFSAMKVAEACGVYPNSVWAMWKKIQL